VHCKGIIAAKTVPFSEEIGAWALILSGLRRL
jgi:hypothetical protein